jgi:hypothetical protein
MLNFLNLIQLHSSQKFILKRYKIQVTSLKGLERGRGNEYIIIQYVTKNGEVMGESRLKVFEKSL